MAVYSEIQSLLAEHLNGIANLPDVSWENDYYEPDANTLYLEAFLFPNDSQNPSIGPNSPTYESGIFQVNVVGVRGQGWFDVYSWVDTIVENFTRGSTLTNSATTIKLRILKTYPNPGFYNDIGRYVVPVDINYYCYDFNV
jgi:hypothetical protein